MSEINWSQGAEDHADLEKAIPESVHEVEQISSQAMAAENEELRRRYEECQQANSRVHDELKAMSEKLHELKSCNRQLKGEVSDLRVQLSYATQTLIDNAKATGVSEEKLRTKIRKQTKKIQKYQKESADAKGPFDFPEDWEELVA